MKDPNCIQCREWELCPFHAHEEKNIDEEEKAVPYIDQIWPDNVYPKPKLWDKTRCGVNSQGAQPVYGPFPRLPRPELGHQTGIRHEVRFRTCYAQLMPFSIDIIYVRRSFNLTEPTPGVLEWVENNE